MLMAKKGNEVFPKIKSFTKSEIASHKVDLFDLNCTVAKQAVNKRVTFPILKSI